MAIKISGSNIIDDSRNIVSAGVVTATSAVIGSGVTVNSSGITATGLTITAGSFVGDGSGLSNAGSTLSGASGSQRVVVTSLTSGSMTAAATDADLTFDANSNTLSVGGGLVVGAAVTITGDLTVNGTTTTINATTLTVDDKNIELASTASPSDAAADGGGITLKGTTDKTLNWVNSTSAWTSNQDFNLLTGKVYEINGTEVLSSTQVLGKSVPSGTIVGTSDTQTLTNKTLTAYAETVNAHGNTGASPSLTLSNGNVITATLNDNATFTFSTTGVPSGSYSFTLILANDGTGGRTITWPASVKWPNATVPTRTTAANKTDVYTFFTTDGGTSWFGNLSLYNYS